MLCLVQAIFQLFSLVSAVPFGDMYSCTESCSECPLGVCFIFSCVFGSQNPLFVCSWSVVILRHLFSLMWSCLSVKETWTNSSQLR